MKLDRESKFYVACVAIVIVAYLLLSFFSKSDMVEKTEIRPGDSAFRDELVSRPKEREIIHHSQEKTTPSPIITYVLDSFGAKKVDTLSIIRRYEFLLLQKDSLICELLSERIYADTVGDTAAMVKAVINEVIQRNAIQNRSVKFMNYRPTSITTFSSVNDKQGQLYYSFIGGYNFQVDPLIGVGLDYINKNGTMFGVAAGTGFIIKSDRFVLLRFGKKF